MFLTRYELDPQRREVGKWLTAPNTMHAALMSAVGGNSGRVLWRLDRHETLAELYVVSPHEFDPDAIAVQGAIADGAGWQRRDMTPLLDNLAVGQQWRFRLTATPTVSVAQLAGDGAKRRGKVVPILSRDDQLTWLDRKLAAAGGSIGSEPERTAYVHEQKRFVFGRKTEAAHGSGARVTLNIAIFDGLLTVTDPALLRGALVDGVGRAKGYGCGLLTLARP